MNKLKTLDIEFALKNKQTQIEALDYCWEAGYKAAKAASKKEMKRLMSIERKLNAFLKRLKQ